MKKLLFIFLFLSTSMLWAGCNAYRSEAKSLVVEVMDHPGGLAAILKRHPRSRKFHDYLVTNVSVSEEVEYIRSFNRSYSISSYRVANAFLQPGRRATVLKVMRSDGARELEFYFSMPEEGGELFGWIPLIHWDAGPNGKGPYSL